MDADVREYTYQATLIKVNGAPEQQAVQTTDAGAVFVSEGGHYLDVTITVLGQLASAGLDGVLVELRCRPAGRPAAHRPSRRPRGDRPDQGLPCGSCSDPTAPTSTSTGRRPTSPPGTQVVRDWESAQAANLVLQPARLVTASERMIDLAAPARTFEGVTVMADHADPLRFHYLPVRPRLVADESGRPELTLLQYQLDEQTQGVSGAGVFSLAVDLEVDDDMLTGCAASWRPRSATAAYADPGLARFRHLPIDHAGHRWHRRRHDRGGHRQPLGADDPGSNTYSLAGKQAITYCSRGLGRTAAARQARRAGRPGPGTARSPAPGPGRCGRCGTSHSARR